MVSDNDWMIWTGEPTPNSAFSVPDQESKRSGEITTSRNLGATVPGTAFVMNDVSQTEILPPSVGGQPSQPSLHLIPGFLIAETPSTQRASSAATHSTGHPNSINPTTFSTGNVLSVQNTHSGFPQREPHHSQQITTTVHGQRHDTGSGLPCSATVLEPGARRNNSSQPLVLSEQPLTHLEQVEPFSGIVSSAFSAQDLKRSFPWARVSTLSGGRKTIRVLQLNKDQTADNLSFKSETVLQKGHTLVTDGQNDQLTKTADTSWSMSLKCGFECLPNSPSYSQLSRSPYLNFQPYRQPSQTAHQAFNELEETWFREMCEKVENEGAMKRDGDKCLLDKNRTTFSWIGPVTLDGAAFSDLRREVTVELRFDIKHSFGDERDGR